MKSTTMDTAIHCTEVSGGHPVGVRWYFGLDRKHHRKPPYTEITTVNDNGYARAPSMESAKIHAEGVKLKTECYANLCLRDFCLQYHH